MPILVGGQNDPVPVHLQNSDRLHNCLATRELAKGIGTHLFTTPLRVSGIGRWFRDREGAWTMKSFRIQEYEVLKSESLADATEGAPGPAGRSGRAAQGGLARPCASHSTR